MRMPMVKVLMVVMVVAALTSDTEASWMSKTLRKVGKITKKTIRNEAVRGVVNVVKRYGPAMMAGVRLLGKRSVDVPLVGSISDQKAREVVRALDLACTKFIAAKGVRDLSAQDVQTAFAATDGNADKTLNGQEFSFFENTLDAIKHCWEMLKSHGK